MKDKLNKPVSHADEEGEIDLNPLPVYPPADDIYNKSKNEEDINPENILKNKTLNEEEGLENEKDFDEDVSGDDLDVPGSELDDEDENMGNEDEENNYYSLGGDDHNDLEEDRGE